MTQTHQQHRSPLLNRRETYVAVTGAAYTAKAGDQVVGVNRAGVVTVTLPTAEVRPGRIYTVKDEPGAASTNNITVATDGSETIDGSATKVMATDCEARSFYSDGSNWFIMPVTPNESPGLSNVVEDTTPQLGGNLDIQTNILVGDGGSTGRHHRGWARPRAATSLPPVGNGSCHRQWKLPKLAAFGSKSTGRSLEMGRWIGNIQPNDTFFVPFR